MSQFSQQCQKTPLPRQLGQETPASESLTLALAQGGLAKAAERILFRLEVDAGGFPVDGGKSVWSLILVGQKDVDPTFLM